MTAAGIAAPLAALALSHAGMAGLALAMDRHHEQATGRAEVPRAQCLVLRAAASLLLALALAACTGAWGATVGFVAWCGFLTAGGLLAGLLFTYRPGLAVRAAALALAAGLCAAWAASGAPAP